MNAYLLLIILFLFAVLIYLKLFLPLSYWRRQKVLQVYPIYRLLKVLLCLSNESLQDVYQWMYKTNKNRRYFGTYMFLQPALFVNDIDLIKQITIKDFDHFHTRIDFLNNSSDKLLKSNLMTLSGKKWREMRSILSPAFTISKIKAMYPLISKTAKVFSKHLEESAGKSEKVLELKTKDLFQKYTNDVVVSCCFGIELNSLQENEENAFLQVGKIFAEPNLWTLVKGIFYMFVPKIFNFFSINVLPVDIADIFINAIMKSIDQHEKLNINRPDLINLMIKAKKGQLKDDTNENLYETGFATVKEHKSTKNDKTGELVLTNEMIASQASLFYLAGFSTNSTFFQFFSYEMALHPEIQRKLQKEIDSEIAKSDNKEISYEALVKMKYLDQTVCEVLRKWPSAYVLARKCTEDYVIEPVNSSEKRLVVEKGCMIMIPAMALYYDPEFFSDPEKFDPEHFSDENKAKTVSGSYIPFGIGPRNCIASRFGLLVIKAQIVNLLLKFDIVPTQKTNIPIKLTNRVMTECKDVWLGFQKHF